MLARGRSALGQLQARPGILRLDVLLGAAGHQQQACQYHQAESRPQAVLPLPVHDVHHLDGARAGRPCNLERGA